MKLRASGIASMGKVMGLASAQLVELQKEISICKKLISLQIG
jgi:hypothetical protein